MTYLLNFFFQRNFTQLNCQLQIELSDKINLVEQIDMVLNIINFGIVDPNNEIPDKFTSSRIKPKFEDISEKLIECLTSIQECIDSIRKSDLAEIKTLAAPPAAVESVSEAICYLFSKQPNFKNFKLLINTTDFIHQLKNFDFDSVNDYKINQIKKYIEMPNFNPDYLKKISRAGSILCNWIINVYNYCSLKASVNCILN